jgi:hypothetical protein
MASDDITDVERLVEFWHSPGGDPTHGKDLGHVAADVLKELKAVKIVRETAADPVNPTALIRSATSYLDELDRA